MSHSLHTKSLPREFKKSKQKVQFAEFQELDVRKTKQTHETNGKLGSHTSSLTSLHKDYNHKKSNRQTYSLERQVSRNNSLTRTSPIHRRQSDLRSRTVTPSSSSELTRTHSLDKKHFNKLSQVDEQSSSRSSIELRPESKDRKISKRFEDRSLSLEEPLSQREKSEKKQLILTQNGVNKHVNNGASSIFKDHPFNKSIGECSQRLRRAVSRSPKRKFNKENNEEFDKENEKLKEKRQTPVSPERQARIQANKKENKNDFSVNGKINKP